MILCNTDDAESTGCLDCALSDGLLVVVASRAYLLSRCYIQRLRTIDKLKGAAA